MRDFLLQRHGATMALVFDFRRNLTGHFRGARSLFPRIFEDAKSLESRPLDKSEQCFKFAVCFAWEPDNESAAQSDSRNSGTQFVDQIFDMRPAGFPPHSAKHRFVNMLQRDV